MKRLSSYLFPIFLFLLPLGLVGHLEQTPAAPLLPYTIAALVSILLGAYLAKKAGVML